MDKREKRHYKTSSLEVFDTTFDGDKKLDPQVIYSEINNNYRFLADVRFKLLGLVPVVSILAWAELIDKLPIDSNMPWNASVGLATAILGMLITYGIRIYDKRNDELYDDLISRGRRLEDECGIDTGIFKGRLCASKFTFCKVKINHDNGLNFVYRSVLLGWGMVIIYFSFSVIQHLRGIL